MMFVIQFKNYDGSVSYCADEEDGMLYQSNNIFNNDVLRWKDLKSCEKFFNQKLSYFNTNIKQDINICYIDISLSTSYFSKDPDFLASKIVYQNDEDVLKLIGDKYVEYNKGGYNERF